MILRHLFVSVFFLFGNFGCMLHFPDVAACGDGVVVSGEECDDGNVDDGDGCSADCRVETGWSCTGAPSRCESSCGNGVIVGQEECDDGNVDDGDGCSADCRVETGWSCTGAPSHCESGCGDGAIVGQEECDDGNADDGDGCSADCRVESGWSCTGVPSHCESGCGDGAIVGQEECDDGNGDGGDGCSEDCRVETGYSCVGQPSVCDSTCGDRIVAFDETCDDGNTEDGDGCSGDCQVMDRYFVPRAAGPMVVDGRLDEYEGVQRIVLTVPETGAVAVFRLMWDDVGLYIVVDVRDTDLEATITEQDGQVWRDDAMEIVLDVGRDGTGNTSDAHIIINILEVVIDSLHGDMSWSATLATAVRMQGTLGDPSDEDLGYQMEVLIHWDSLGVPAPMPAEEWGMDVQLSDRRGDEYWQVPWWNSDGGWTGNPQGLGTMEFMGQ